MYPALQIKQVIPYSDTTPHSPPRGTSSSLLQQHIPTPPLSIQTAQSTIYCSVVKEKKNWRSLTLLSPVLGSSTLYVYESVPEKKQEEVSSPSNDPEYMLQLLQQNALLQKHPLDTPPPSSHLTQQAIELLPLFIQQPSLLEELPGALTNHHAPLWLFLLTCAFVQSDTTLLRAIERLENTPSKAILLLSIAQLACHHQKNNPDFCIQAPLIDPLFLEKLPSSQLPDALSLTPLLTLFPNLFPVIEKLCLQAGQRTKLIQVCINWITGASLDLHSIPTQVGSIALRYNPQTLLSLSSTHIPFLKKILEQDPRLCKKLPPTTLLQEIVLSLLEKDPSFILHCSEELQENQEFLLQAIERNSYVFPLAQKHIPLTPTLYARALETNSNLIVYLDTYLFPLSLLSASPKLQADFWINILSYTAAAFPYIPLSLQKDPTFLIQALTCNDALLSWIPSDHPLYKDPALFSTLLSTHPTVASKKGEAFSIEFLHKALFLVPSAVQNDPSFWQQLLLHAIFPPTNSTLDAENKQLLEKIPTPLKNNPTFLLSLASTHPLVIRYIEIPPSLLLNIVEKHPKTFSFLFPHHLEFCRTAIQKLPSLFSYLPLSWQERKIFVLSLLAIQPHIFPLLPLSLRNSPSFVLQAIQANHTTLAYIPQKWHKAQSQEEPI